MVDAGVICRFFRNPWRYYATTASRFIVIVAVGAGVAACQNPINGGGEGGSASHLITASETPTVVHVPSVSLTSPGAGRIYTNGDTLTLTGKCEPLFTITLSGASYQTTTCNSEGGWGLTATNTVDGEYNYALNMNDPAGVDYGSLEFTWVRDTLLPSAPTIGSPSSSPYNSNDPTLTITGTCELGATVSLGGDASGSVTCDAGTYTFTIPKPDGTYNFTVTQTDPAGNASPSTSLKWNKNVSLPSTPTVTLPTSDPFYSKASTFTISGGCTTGDTVTLGGASSQTATCASGLYSFTVTKGTDGSYAFSVTQTDPGTALTSGANNQTWVRDTVAPAQLTVSSPASNPLTSGDTTITISGPCEVGTTVALSGDATASAVCTTGTYGFSVTKSTDGTYNFSLVQTDPAGNASSPRTFSWTRDTSIPATPTILAPSTNPFYSKNSSLVISGGCVTGNLLTLSGASSQTTTCVASSYSFTISQSTDATYAFSITQENPNNSNVSNPASQTWIRDTVAPSAPTITSPSSNPLISGASTITLSGGCETGATVALAGASSATQACTSGTYSFAISKSVDGTYNFTVAQTDRAGNSSSTTAFQWIRDTAVPSAPAILSPSINPFYSNSSTLNISGTCTMTLDPIPVGYTVNLAGAATQSTTCVSSNFSFSVSKTSDGTYDFTITQTNPNNGQTSSNAAQTWVRDTSVPAQVTISSPASNPYASGDTTLTIAGGCETGAAVQMSGASTGSTTCASSAYTLSTTKSTDGTYSYSIVQMDAAGNQSTAKSFQWTRDTSTPPAPTITLPGTSPYYSSSSTLAIAGDCQNGLTVSLSGADTQSTTCVGLSYAFSVTKTSDALYVFGVTQTNPNNGNVSAATSLSWVRDTTAPSAPSITSPASNPYASGDTTLTIAGACETGATVNLTGATTGAVTCASSAFSFSTTKSSDGTYDYSLTQTDLAGNVSSAAPFQWIRTAVPATPTITSPATNPIYSNGSSITISGGCVTGYTVTLGASDDQTMLCAASAYSFTVNKTADSVYNFMVIQTNGAVDSAPASLTWVRDTLAAPMPTLINPNTNPFTSGDTTLAITGNCETGTTVKLTGAGTASTTCARSQFSLTTTKSADGTYTYSLTQTDKAGNASQAAPLVWVRDTTLPFTPLPTSPSANPFYSSASSLTISGTCVKSNTVFLSGPDNLSVTCSAAGTYSFTVNHSVDGAYVYALKQTNTTAGVDSAQYTFTWVRDTTPPAVADGVNPAANPYDSGDEINLEGACEQDDDIAVTGADTQTVSCDDGTYKITTSKGTDGTYSLNLNQKDRAANASSTTTITWNRDSTRPSTPKILVPNRNPFLSNASSFTISGTCKTGAPVSIAGDPGFVASEVTNPANSLVMTCTKSQFSFTVSKTVDGSYNFAIKQAVGVRDSGTHARRWIRDTVPPVTTITSSPASTNLTVNSTFTFTANEAARFECSLDGAAYSVCASPIVYQNLANASHTFNVRAIDLAGNLGTAASYTWAQQAANSIALWHFDTSPGALIDSGLYSGANHNDLTNTGTTAGAAAKFAQSLRFTAASSNYVSVTDRTSQRLGNATMTVEAWLRFATLPTNGTYAVIASKTGASGQFGWEFKVKRLGSNIYLIFDGSLDGTTTTEVRSVQLNGDTTTFHHVAVTWNKGSVKFFLDGVASGSSSIGTAGISTLFGSNADLKLGTNAGTGQFLDGTLDEVRISQIVRWNASFTPPTSAYTAD